MVDPLGLVAEAVVQEQEVDMETMVGVQGADMVVGMLQHQLSQILGISHPWEASE